MENSGLPKEDTKRNWFCVRGRLLWGIHIETEASVMKEVTRWRVGPISLDRGSRKWGEVFSHIRKKKQTSVPRAWGAKGQGGIWQRWESMSEAMDVKAIPRMWHYMLNKIVTHDQGLIKWVMGPDEDFARIIWLLCRERTEWRSQIAEWQNI